MGGLVDSEVVERASNPLKVKEVKEVVVVVVVPVIISAAAAIVL